ncbi:MAG: hypothetical protein NPIRA01_17580 [Nitrospirales bacterium]|nr:MAG: hypothetical protein NPIRA01_17580 [Nitrospirales bacterium]
MTKRRPSVIDSDFAKVGAALERAAANAKLQGLQTNTPVWVIRDGVMVDLVAESKKKKRSRVNIIKGGMSRERLAKRTPKRS